MKYRPYNPAQRRQLRTFPLPKPDLSPAPPKAAWCERHWLPYRDGIANYPLASLLVSQALIADPRFKSLTGFDPDTKRSTDDARSAFNAAIESLKPVCCWLGDEVMAGIEAKARQAMIPPDPDPRANAEPIDAPEPEPS